jgi:hypothetical protein
MREFFPLILSAPLVLSLGARGVAGHLATRIFGSGSAIFVLLYCTILATSLAMTVWCVGLFGWPVLTWTWALAMLATVPAGAACAFLDRKILQSAWSRRLRFERRRNGLNDLNKRSEPSDRGIVKVPLFAGDRRTKVQTMPPKRAPAGRSAEPALALNIGLACLEEFVYRGAVVQLASAFGSTPFYWAILAISILIFCVGHSNFGIDHIYSKLPLALACMCLALFQGVLPALSCHVVFNIIITSWIDRRRLAHDLA